MIVDLKQESDQSDNPDLCAPSKAPTMEMDLGAIAKK